MKKTKITDKRINNIKSYLDNYRDNIPFAFLFGSWAEGKQTPLSDIDIAIFFRDMRESEKTKVEHQISSLFHEKVNILRLEDEYISPLIKLEALNGVPILITNIDILNRFTLSIIHKAEELKKILNRLRKVA